MSTPERPEYQPGDPVVPFSSVVPGMRPGEGPEGPAGALSAEQRTRMMLAGRAQVARQLGGVVRSMELDSAAPALEAAASVAPATPRVEFSPAAEPATEEPTAAGGIDARIYGRRVQMTAEEVEALAAAREATRLRDIEREKKAEELYGPPRHTGWEIGAPSRRKLLSLLAAHHQTDNLCATCKHAVQIVHPLPDLGGVADAHQIRTFCSVIREEGGRNLEIEDSPLNFCSFYRWSVRATLRRERIRLEVELLEPAEGQGPVARLRRAAAALFGVEANGAMNGKGRSNGEGGSHG